MRRPQIMRKENRIMILGVVALISSGFFIVKFARIPYYVSGDDDAGNTVLYCLFCFLALVSGVVGSVSVHKAGYIAGKGHVSDGNLETNSPYQMLYSLRDGTAGYYVVLRDQKGEVTLHRLPTKPPKVFKNIGVDDDNMLVPFPPTK